jgi:hypothetical protein
MRIGTSINDYETMLKRLIAASERPKVDITKEQQAFWDGQAKAYNGALKHLYKFKDKVFALPPAK